MMEAGGGPGAGSVAGSTYGHNSAQSGRGHSSVKPSSNPVHTART